MKTLKLGACALFITTAIFAGIPEDTNALQSTSAAIQAYKTAVQNNQMMVNAGMMPASMAEKRLDTVRDALRDVYKGASPSVKKQMIQKLNSAKIKVKGINQ